MIIGSIEPCSEERDWFSRWLYPIYVVQDFQPCGWDNLNAFFRETEIMQDILHERSQWLVDLKIKSRVHYLTTEDLTQVAPRHYRLYVEFKNVQGEEAYRLQWQSWVLGENTIR